jgi:hypothetical protein
MEHAKIIKNLWLLSDRLMWFFDKDSDKIKKTIKNS